LRGSRALSVMARACSALLLMHAFFNNLPRKEGSSMFLAWLLSHMSHSSIQHHMWMRWAYMMAVSLGKGTTNQTITAVYQICFTPLRCNPIW